VTDTSDLTSTATSTTATIKAQSPVANPGGPYAGLPGIAVNFNGSASTDPQNETLTYAWNFGDSTAGTGVSPTHSYSAAGNYTVSLTVNDTSNLTSTINTIATIDIIGPTVNGTVASGSGISYGDPVISGAHIYLFAVNTTGYGQPSISLLNSSDTGHSDEVGSYVLTNSTGSFSIPPGYICPFGSQLYIYTLGGTIGTVTNSAAGLLAALGPCNSLISNNSVWVDSVTTIAAAYALSGFATDAIHISSSGSALAQIGVANAFANAANIVSISTGSTLATTPAGNGSVPQFTIGTIAKILNYCISSTGPSSPECSTLFTNAKSSGSTGAVPTDTATAAINIAHNPGSNIAALCSILPYCWDAPGALPNDFTIGIAFTGGGMSQPWTIAIDGSGNAWIGSQTAWTVTELSSTGAILSGPNGYTGNGLVANNGIAIDGSGNAWITDGDGYVTEISSSGFPLSGSFPDGKAGGYTSPSMGGDRGIAIDAANNAWVTNLGGDSNTTEFSSTGSVLSGESGYSSNYMRLPYDIAIDGSGDVWALNSTTYDGATITKLSNSGAVLSGTGGYDISGTIFNSGLAIDSSGNAWFLTSGGPTSSLVKVSNSGVLLGQYTGGGLAYPYKIALDGAGNVWVINCPNNSTEGSYSVSEFNKNGIPITGSSGYISSGYNGSALVLGPSDIAIDGSGDVWIMPGFNQIDNGGTNFVVELIGAAVPVITPIAAGLPQTPTTDGTSNLATRP
jgi:hypothetical protein